MTFGTNQKRSSPPGGVSAARLTSEQIKAVADRVYTLFLNDLKIENERRRWKPGRKHSIQGGRL
jgi:hypothetical protein